MVVFTFQTEGRYNLRDDLVGRYFVVFTFQTEGRYNRIVTAKELVQVVFTFQTEGRYNADNFAADMLIVVFTFQTEGRYNLRGIALSSNQLFLPFKQKADTTEVQAYRYTRSCFYLSNRRQIQQIKFLR